MNCPTQSDARPFSWKRPSTLLLNNKYVHAKIDRNPRSICSTFSWAVQRTKSKHKRYQNKGIESGPVHALPSPSLQLLSELRQHQALVNFLCPVRSSSSRLDLDPSMAHAACEPCLARLSNYRGFFRSNFRRVGRGIGKKRTKKKGETKTPLRHSKQAVSKEVKINEITCCLNFPGLSREYQV